MTTDYPTADQRWHEEIDTYIALTDCAAFVIQAYEARDRLPLGSVGWHAAHAELQQQLEDLAAREDQARESGYYVARDGDTLIAQYDVDGSSAMVQPSEDHDRTLMAEALEAFASGLERRAEDLYEDDDFKNDEPYLVDLEDKAARARQLLATITTIENEE